MDINKAALALDVDIDATSEEVEIAYKKLASEFHPDRGGDTDKMARLNKAREVLQEHFSVKNLPAVIKQFELTVKEMNVIAREQRTLEKRVEKAEKELFSSSTNKLKSYKQIAIVLAAISTAAIFLGKDIPKELTSNFMPEVGEKPMAVSLPQKDAWVDIAMAKFKKIKEAKDKKKVAELTKQEMTALEKYQKEERKYMEYRSHLYKYEDLKERVKRNTSMWYLITFSIGIYAGVGAWFFNRKIQRVEDNLEELLEDLSIKSQYAHILLDLFEGNIKVAWSFSDLQQAVISNGPENDRLRPLLRTIDPKRITQFLITKGLESSALNVAHGNHENGYEEAYSIA